MSELVACDLQGRFESPQYFLLVGHHRLVEGRVAEMVPGWGKAIKLMLSNRKEREKKILGEKTNKQAKHKGWTTINSLSMKQAKGGR